MLFLGPYLINPVNIAEIFFFRLLFVAIFPKLVVFTFFITWPPITLCVSLSVLVVQNLYMDKGSD